MSTLLRLLQVEDSESDAALIARLLGKGGYAIESTRVDDASAMEAALAAATWDIIIADHNMGQFDAPGALRVLHQSGQDIPFIVVSGSIGEEMAVTLMKSGAHDYVLKNNLARLVPAVERELREAQTRRERSQAESALRDSESRLALAIRATHLGTFDLLPHIGVMFFSEQTRIHLGHSPEMQPTFETLRRSLHPDDCERVLAAMATLLEGDKEAQYADEYRTVGIEDGVERWISAWGRVFFDTERQTMRCVGVTLDVTEKKKLAEQFQNAQRRLRDIVVSSPAILFTMALAGDQIHGVSWISENLFEILGYRPEQALGIQWFMSGTHPDDLLRVRTATTQGLFTVGHTEDEFRFRHADGSYRWTQCDIRLLRDEAGRAIEAVGSWSDISGRKRGEEEERRLREQLQQAQKLESVGRLAGGVAHDFNNLLTVINGYSDLLLKQITADDPLYEGLTEIHLAGERAATLSQQLLVLSRKGVVQPKNLNLNDIIVEVERMLHRVIGEDIRLESILDDSLGRVLADPGQMHQILMNLAVNARDAMPGGGTIVIETENVELDESYTLLHAEVKPGRYIRLKVSDTGAGMTKEVQSHLFEPFFTTKKAGQGTGLGLATVYGIVKQCAGSIWVYSEPGDGTTFSIYLPRVDEPCAEEVADVPTPLLRGTETILVVEDQEQLRKMAAKVLRGYGYTVLDAATPLEALALSARHSDTLHMLLTDVVMPGMSGPELAARLHHLRPSMKIVLMSGYCERNVADRSNTDLCDGYLAKPFSPQSLAAKVYDTLHPPPANRTILMVDDEPAIRNILRAILTEAGYSVMEAENGREAMQLIKSSTVDLIITDLVMPEQEGIETIQALRQKHANLKIIAISGQFAGPMLHAAEILGAHASLTKPIEPNLLRQTIARLLS
jgi:PAS domain S-box-containing protein